jgi:hypothetical protein
MRNGQRGFLPGFTLVAFRALYCERTMRLHHVTVAVRRCAFALFALVASGRVLPAQSTGTSAPPAGPAPTPCADAAERHRFDFWIGEWDVTTKGGTHVGSSVVESVSGGCALLENWTSARGGHGKSLNSYNPAVGQWQQYWIGQDGNPTEYRESTWEGASIVLRAHAPASGTTPATEQRLTFSPLDSVTVRQHGETSTDGGATWTTTYDFYYHRKH